MREQQDRLARAGAAQARDEIALARRRREDLNVCVGETAARRRAAIASAACGGVAGRRHRVDLDQLLVDVERALLVARSGPWAASPGQKATWRAEISMPRKAPSDDARIFA